MGDVRADGDVRSSSSIVAELRKQKLEQKFHVQKKKKTEKRKSPVSKSERAERNDETAERRNNAATVRRSGARDHWRAEPGKNEWEEGMNKRAGSLSINFPLFQSPVRGMMSIFRGRGALPSSSSPIHLVGRAKPRGTAAPFPVVALSLFLLLLGAKFPLPVRSSSASYSSSASPSSSPLFPSSSSASALVSGQHRSQPMEQRGRNRAKNIRGDDGT